MCASSGTFAENEPLGPSLGLALFISIRFSLSLSLPLFSFRFPKLCASIPSVIFGNLAFLLIGGTRFVAHENATERSYFLFLLCISPVYPAVPSTVPTSFFYGVFRRSCEFQQHPLPLSPTITTVASAGCKRGSNIRVDVVVRIECTRDGKAIRRCVTLYESSRFSPIKFPPFVVNRSRVPFKFFPGFNIGATSGLIAHFSRADPLSRNPRFRKPITRLDYFERRCVLVLQNSLYSASGRYYGCTRTV